MAIQKKDYYTFLGGEVSPNLFKRVDMRAANKWFETAKNIFFDTTGGFFNRVGTEVVDNTYSSAEKVKLVKFVYNKQQSYDVVISKDYIKIFDDKTLLFTVTDNIPDFTLSSDIIYTQIGDIIYLCFGNTTRIYTLKRFANNNWVLDAFNYNIPPMLDVNVDKSKQLSFQKNTSYASSKYSSFTFISNNSLLDTVVFYVDNYNTQHELYSYLGDTRISTNQLIENFNLSTGTNLGFEMSVYSQSQSYMLKIKIPQGYNDLVKKIGITSKGYTSCKWGEGGSVINSTDGFNYDGEIHTHSLYDINIVQTLHLNIGTGANEPYKITKQYSYSKPYATITDIYNDIVSEFPEMAQEVTTLTGKTFIPIEIVGNELKLRNCCEQPQGVSYYYRYGISDYTYMDVYNLSYNTDRTNTFNIQTEEVTSTDSIYTVTSNFDFFINKDVDSVFAIESVYTPSPSGTYGENKTVSVTQLNSGSGYLPFDQNQGTSGKGFWSNGNWRLVTSGLMEGSLELQYSYDGVTWYTHRSFTSGIKTVSGVSSSTLYNEYGTLDVDDNVLLRLKYNVTNSGLGVTFDTDSFENRSYYKILSKLSNSSAVVECIKYSIGTPTDTYQWAESAWSDAEGYPAICFTYQNRLCFAKTNNNPFVVWTSKTNDYSAFDTKIKYQDDDPITMDIVKFNGVSNIATVAALNKLFVFTEDAEYGIQDQGALTQANKSLVSFSKYGAEPLETQVSGNRIVFVENGGKAARQLFYDFAQENYEAPDITVLYKHLLKNEKIIATDYVGLDYRMYLMLTNTGRVICYKYIPEQEVTACSWFMHAKGTITNISALDVGNNTVRIYMAVDIGSRKQLEVMDLTNENYLDSRHTFTTDTATTTIDTTGYFDNGDEVCYFLNGIKHTAIIENNTLTLEEEIPADTSIEVGYPYEAEATLIPMSAIARNGSANYTKKNIFKANFEYFDSVAFKVGMKSYQNEFEEIKYEDGSVGTENTPHSGEKTDIIILSSYLDKNMLSFKQTEPYKMNITNLEVEVDYGN